MSRQTPIRADIDPDGVPPRAPKNPNERVVENRAREPAAAQGKVAKAGAPQDGKAPLIPTPRTSAATTHAVNEDQSEDRDAPVRDPADVRAGPGDAGGQRSPRIVPRTVDKPRASRRSFAVFLGLILGALVVLALAAWL